MWPRILLVRFEYHHHHHQSSITIIVIINHELTRSKYERARLPVHGEVGKHHWAFCLDCQTHAVCYITLLGDPGGDDDDDVDDNDDDDDYDDDDDDDYDDDDDT